MNREEKSTTVSSLSERLKDAKAIFIAEYRGLKVSEVTEIRKEMRKNAGEFKVVKNRLAKKAIEGSVWNPLGEHLRGPLALAVCDQDPVTISKVLAKFAENYAALKLKAACMDGRIIDAKGIVALSKLPSKEELYQKVLGILLAPATGIVRVLHGVPQKLAVALKAISEKKQ